MLTSASLIEGTRSMEKVPFSAYDFFSYLFAGALLIAGVDYAFNLYWVLGRQLDVTQISVWLVIAFVIGWVNSHWASWLLEGKIVKLLGRPENLLFTDTLCRVFRHYRSPLLALTADRILDKYQLLSGATGEGRDAYLYCYHLVKRQCSQAYARLQTFINLYGFSRNLSFATGLISLALMVGRCNRPCPFLGRLIVTSAVVSIPLFYRYLKFYRHFTIEVFTSYLTSVKKPG